MTSSVLARPTLTPLQAPPDPLIPLDSDEWKRWFYKVWETIGAGVGNSGPQATFPQVQIGKTTLSSQQDNTLGILTMNQGLGIIRNETISGLLYGIACLISRSVGVGNGFVVASQFTAIAEKGVANTSVFGSAIEAWCRPGANVTLIGSEPSVINEESTNLYAKWALNTVFKDRPDGAASTTEGLGSNFFNYFSVGLCVTAADRSSAGEFCGFNAGIDFLSRSLDEALSPAWSAAATYQPGQCVASGGNVYKCTTTHINQVPPNVNFWVQRIAGTNISPAVGIDFSSLDLTSLARLGSGIRFRESIKFHWDAAGSVATYMTAAGTALILCELNGTPQLQVTLATGVLQVGNVANALGGGAGATLGTIGGGGPAVAAQAAWLKIKDGAGATYWVPVWN